MSNATTVTAIGRADRETEDTAALVIVHAESGETLYDWTSRGAIPRAIVAWVESDGSKLGALQKGPKGAQVSTDDGRGVDAVRKAVKSLLADETADKSTDYLARVIKAALAANKHEITAGEILSAVAAALAETIATAA